MRNFNERQIKILKDNFNYYEDDSIIQLEKWTDGGVDMVIYIDKNENIDYMEQLENYVKDFDIDEELEVHRGNKQYRQNFTITEGIEDFKNFIEEMKNIICILKGQTKETDKKDYFNTIKHLIEEFFVGLDFEDGELDCLIFGIMELYEN